MPYMEMVYQMPEKRDRIDKVNQECYDNCASYWDRFPFPNILPKMIAKYYDGKLGNRVLDVGSGTGKLAKWLDDMGYDVLCIDPSPEMVRRCTEKGLKTLQSSIQEYQPEGQFSMIFAILSLIHVPKGEYSAQIKKLADAMPANGILFLAMIEGKEEGIFEGGKYPRFFAYYTPEEILSKTAPYFTKLDYQYEGYGNIGYLVFALKKK